MTDRLCCDAYIFDTVNLSMADQLDCIAKAGFKNVFVSILDNESGECMVEYGKLAKERGLRIVNVHLPYLSNTCLWFDTQERKDFINKLLYQIDLVAALGTVESVVIHQYSSKDCPINPLGIESFEILCNHAAKYNIDVLVENIWESEHIDYLFKNVKAQNLKFVHDAGHEFCFTPKVDVLKKYGSRLAFTHLHDNDGKSDLHDNFGNGSLNFKKLKKRYEEIGYQGYLSAEVVCWDKYFSTKEHFQTWVDHAYKFMTKIWG